MGTARSLSVGGRTGMPLAPGIPWPGQCCRRRSGKWRLPALRRLCPDPARRRDGPGFLLRPLAMTGTGTAPEMAAVRSRSYPESWPSASMLVSKISPEPRSTAWAAHLTASIPVSCDHRECIPPIRSSRPGRWMSQQQGAVVLPGVVSRA